ncbi:MAG: DUF192 domain-containing protein [Gemmatimonadales bacterium]|nr:MAG: DUF192 domain-containing protein [Gemmatimonadales bacterium]
MLPSRRRLPSPPISPGILGPVLPALLALLSGCGADLNGEGSPATSPGDGAARETATPAGTRDRPMQGMAWVIIANDTVHAEVADTPESRERGLMYRTELEDGQGMLFVYSSMATRSFWMRNTFIPLDIAFLDDRQVIVDIQQMEPETETLHESGSPAMFALEVPGGWYASRGIRIGAQARIVFGRR